MAEAQKMSDLTRRSDKEALMGELLYLMKYGQVIDNTGELVDPEPLLVETVAGAEVSISGDRIQNLGEKQCTPSYERNNVTSMTDQGAAIVGNHQVKFSGTGIRQFIIYDKGFPAGSSELWYAAYTQAEVDNAGGDAAMPAKVFNDWGDRVNEVNDFNPFQRCPGVPFFVSPIYEEEIAQVWLSANDENFAGNIRKIAVQGWRV